MILAVQYGNSSCTCFEISVTFIGQKNLQHASLDVHIGNVDIHHQKQLTLVFNALHVE